MKFEHLLDEGKVLHVFTHDHAFNCDDVFSYALLKLYCEKCHFDMDFKRVAHISEIDKVGVVFDFGFKYDPENGYFDHHQNDSPTHKVKKNYYVEEFYEEKRSSFGLLWEYIGECFLKRRSNWIFDTSLATVIDHADVHGSNDTLMKIIKEFNPNCMEEKSKEFEDQQFLRAAELAEVILRRRFIHLKHNHTCGIRAYRIAMTEEVKESGILVIDNYTNGVISAMQKRCPWVKFIIAADRRETAYLLFHVYADKIGTPLCPMIKSPKATFQNERFAKFLTIEDAKECAIDSLNQQKHDK